MKKIAIIFLGISLLGFLSSCVDKDNVKDSLNKDNKEKIVNSNKGDIKKDNIKDNTLIANKDKASENGLGDILEDLSKEEQEAKIKKEEEMKKYEIIIGKYLVSVNKDEDIYNYIDSSSIQKIKKETTDTYNKLTSEEKELFLNDIKGLGYGKKTFNPNKAGELSEYINIIVKSGLKKEGEIKGFDINDYAIVKDNKDKTYVDIDLEYKNGKKTKLKFFIIKDKISITF